METAGKTRNMALTGAKRNKIKPVAWRFVNRESFLMSRKTLISSLGAGLHQLTSSSSNGLDTHKIMESQTGWAWKGPLEVTQSKPPAQAGPSGAGSPGPGPNCVWVPPSREPLWASCACAWSPSQQKSDWGNQLERQAQDTTVPWNTNAHVPLCACISHACVQLCSIWLQPRDAVCRGTGSARRYFPLKCLFFFLTASSLVSNMLSISVKQEVNMVPSQITSVPQAISKANIGLPMKNTAITHYWTYPVIAWPPRCTVNESVHF